MAPQKNIPIATALRASLRGYGFSTFRHDLIAGFVVSMIALPLAMALSIAVGLPPQHGIYTAIIAGIAAALLGGAPLQVSGPTAAFVVIIAPIVAEHGLHGLIWCEILAGFFLIIMGTARLGRTINYVPYPVTTGFTAGIAVVILTLSLNDVLGLNLGTLKGEYIEKFGAILRALPDMDVYAASVGAVTLLTVVFMGRLVRFIPSTATGLAAGAALAAIFAHYGHDIATIGNSFTYETAQGLKHGIPPYPPQFHWPNLRSDDVFALPDLAELRALFVPALVVAALAAIESLLSATVADSMTGRRHDPNAELNGIGVANILSGLAGGIPATGAIARTATNIHSGAKTPIAAVIHSLLIMLYVLLLAPLINYVPMSALAALLMVAAYRMSHVRQFIRTIRIAPRSDTAVLLACFGFTVFIDMVAGVVVGIILASFLFMKHIAEMTKMDLESGGKAAEGMPDLPPDTMIYRIEGPFFFGTVEKLYDGDDFIQDHVKKLIIDMERVPLIDMSGLVAMKSLLARIASENREIILTGRKDVTGRIMQKIAGSAAAKHVRIAPTVGWALVSEK